MQKEFILDEIRRTAAENGGVPLGRRRFAAETGIQETDWFGVHWSSWGQAVAAAGLNPNTKQGRLPDEHLLERLAGLVLELDHFPVNAELRIKSRQDPDFPSHNTFRRFGPKERLAARLSDFASERAGLERVAEICSSVPQRQQADRPEEGSNGPIEEAAFGSVYLIRAGSYYKIGRTNSLERRERELAIQLPQRAQTVHVIKTDDPAGIESYWHRRFAAKRENGEWFRLDAADVRAFKRRKFM
jgi:hypothetical protein